MGNCLKCNKEIPDDLKLCDDCHNKREEAVLEESYLDNLFSDMYTSNNDGLWPDDSGESFPKQTEEYDNIESKLKKENNFLGKLKNDVNFVIDDTLNKFINNNEENNEVINTNKQNVDENTINTVDEPDNYLDEDDIFNNINDSDIFADVDDIDIFADEDDFYSSEAKSSYNDKNTNNNKELSEINLIGDSIKEDINDNTDLYDDINNILDNISDLEETDDIPDSISNNKISEEIFISEEANDLNDLINNDADTEYQNANEELFSMVDSMLSDDNFQVLEENDESGDSSLDLDMLNMLGIDDLGDFNQSDSSNDSIENTNFENNFNNSEDTMANADDDLMQLLNGMSGDGSSDAFDMDPDIMDLTNLLNDAESDEYNPMADGNLEDTYANALNLENSGDSDSILGLIPDANEKKGNKKGKKGKKDKKNKKDGDKEDKPSLLVKIFGNVKKDEADRPKPEPPKEDSKKAKKKKGKKGEEAETEEGEEGKEDKKGKKGKKDKKDKKGKKGKQQAEAEEGDDGKRRRASDEEDEEQGKDKKKEKKAKKEKKVKEVVAEVEEYEGEINKIGAAIVLIFFSLVCAAIIIGTNMFSYSSSVKSASKYLENKKYVLAYNELSGEEIKDEDKELFNKIQTIMFVNKEYQSYVNFTLLKMYPDALDSLLKGIKKYDEYKNSDLGITEDLDSIKENIITALKDTFEMNESEARTIIKIEDKEKYSDSVREAVKKVVVKEDVNK